MTSQLRAAFVAWARARGHTAPPTEEGMRVLVAQFLGEAMQRGREADEPPQLIGADQAEHADHKINLLRDSGGMLDIADPETEDSDFGEFIRQRHSAMEQAGGDDLAAAVIHREGKTAAVVEQAPFVRNVPPSILDAVIGNQVQVSTPAFGTTLQQVLGKAKEVARWTGSNVEAVPTTITAAPISLVGQHTPGANVLVARPFALVQFGTGGFLNTAEVDVGTGFQMTVAGSSVVVSLGMDALTANVGEDASTMLLQGSLAPNTQITRTAPLIRSRYAVCSQGSFVDVQVPPFAKKCTVFRHDLSHSFSVSFLTEAGAVQFWYSQDIAANALMTTALNLSSPVTVARYVDNTGAGSVNVTFIFELGI